MYKILSEIKSVSDKELIHKINCNKVLKQTWGFETRYSLEEQIDYSIRFACSNGFRLWNYEIRGGTSLCNKVLFSTNDKDMLHCINIPLDSISVIEINGLINNEFINFELCMSSLFEEAMLVINYYGTDDIDDYIKSIALKP